jgi:glycosyltransferase involved in cell wall biosynthesis
MDLSIIVPVYNVEDYIRPCIESIFKQGLNDDDFEVIIVNDGTEDNSIGVIQDIINEHNNVTVINQENQGLSVARNNGIALAKGEYILMLDSDDLLIENRLPILLDKALETKVDLVVADYLGMTNEEIDNFRQVDQQEFKFQEKTGEQLFLEDLNPYQCGVWRTLYRRAFLHDNNLHFISGIYYEDFPFTYECYLKAHQCIKMPYFLYIYRVSRFGSITASFSTQKAKSYCTAIAKTWQLTQIKDLSQNTRYKLEEDIYVLYKVMIYNTLHCIKSSSERKSVITSLLIETPNLQFTHTIWQKITTFMIRKMPLFYIELYYYYYLIMYRKVSSSPSCSFYPH